ncbi:histone-lysine N-methyltransferase, H3 lysine-79 specific-like, partial [Heptranchias perlo]|uniref:histone-lysine N-methyltransferase, H3 lysine-79 specific-like n=1 Tax=Heptranchias perlo TaxID=212740 RepID=UPI003559CF56
MARWEMAPYLQIDPLSPYGKNKSVDKLPPISQNAHDSPLPTTQTKLDLLKCQFQQKLEREKQVKLMAIYKQQYQDALYRLRTTCNLQDQSGPCRNPDIEEHSSADSTLVQQLPPEDQDSGWTQVILGPQGKRSAGIDRSHPLRPIERRTPGLGNILNLEGESSDWRSLITLDAAMWPAVTFRPSPPKEPKEPRHSSRAHYRTRERCVELRPLEDSPSPVQLRQRSSQHKTSPCTKGQEPKGMQDNQENDRENLEVEINKKESLIQGRLRKIEEELRQIQRRRDQAEEEEMEEEKRAESGRPERERPKRERPERERSERERPERERPKRERAERERPERERPERERAERERAERERAEREKAERERPKRERPERERPKSERPKSERPKRERAERERAERERAERERAERERAERERAEKAKLVEMEREAKQRQRERLKRESARDVEVHREPKSSSEKSHQMKTRDHYQEKPIAESFDTLSSEEYTDHSNPFADYKEMRCEAKDDTEDDGDDRAHDNDSPQQEGTEWDGHYSPEEKAHCSFCGRRFVLDRLDTHTEICKKVNKRRRKIYDSAKKRAQGTDLENYQCSQQIMPAPVREQKWLFTKQTINHCLKRPLIG